MVETFLLIKHSELLVGLMQRIVVVFCFVFYHMHCTSFFFVDKVYLYKQTKPFVYQHVLQQSLGRCLVVADPPEDQKLAVLNEVWKSVIKLRNPGVGLSLSFIH